MLAGLSPKGSKNKPAGIRSLVYGMGKGKVRIEGFSVSSSRITAKVRIRPDMRFGSQTGGLPGVPTEILQNLYFGAFRRSSFRAFQGIHEGQLRHDLNPPLQI